MSTTGLSLLQKWEGRIVNAKGFHVPYDDANGRPVKQGKPSQGGLTIGYGHLLRKSELTSGKIEIPGFGTVRYWNGLEEDKTMALLDKDLDWAENAVNKYVTVPLSQPQFEALVSFTFNVGATAFKNSTLVRVLNQGHYDQVPAQLKRWNKSGGVVMQGLNNRRASEIVHWNSVGKKEITRRKTTPKAGSIPTSSIPTSTFTPATKPAPHTPPVAKTPVKKKKWWHGLF